MRTIDNNGEIAHLSVASGEPANLHHLTHGDACRACREAEAEVVALLKQFRGAAPPLSADLERRLLDACLSCDSAPSSTADASAMMAAWPSRKT